MVRDLRPAGGAADDPEGAQLQRVRHALRRARRRRAARAALRGPAVRLLFRRDLGRARKLVESWHGREKLQYAKKYQNNLNTLRSTKTPLNTVKISKHHCRVFYSARIILLK